MTSFTFMGGVAKTVRTIDGGVGPNRTKPYKGGGGVKNPDFYPYVLNGWSPRVNHASIPGFELSLLYPSSDSFIFLYPSLDSFYACSNTAQ